MAPCMPSCGATACCKISEPILWAPSKRWSPVCDNLNDQDQITGFSLDSSFNIHALLWQDKNTTPVDLNTLVPADSPWYLLIPGGITNAGEIAVTAINLNTLELHAVVATPIRGIVPAARGATKPPPLPGNIRKLFQRRLRY
jgi:hypothetical protein